MQIQVRNATKFMRHILMPLGFLMITSACMNDQTKQIIEDYEQMFAEALPPGSTADEVIAYLKQQNIEASDYENKAPQLTAIVRDVKKNLIIQTALQLQFTFDEDKSLLDTSINTVFTGP